MFPKEIKSKKAPKPIGPYIQGIKLNNIIFISGQIPINSTKNIIEDNITAQTIQCLKNIQFILEEVKCEIKNIIKTTVFLKDFNEFSDFNLAYKNFFIKNNSNFPTRSCIEVSRLPKDVKVEIEAMAFCLK